MSAGIKVLPLAYRIHNRVNNNKNKKGGGGIFLQFIFYKRVENQPRIRVIAISFIPTAKLIEFLLF